MIFIKLCVVGHFLLLNFVGNIAQYTNYEKRPKIITQDGELILQAAFGKNISLKTVGPKSFIKIDGHDLSSTLKEMINATKFLKKMSTTTSDVNIKQSSTVTPVPLESVDNSGVVRLRRRIQRLETKVERLSQSLSNNDCSSLPCMNGGTCLDLYNNFLCLCPKNWEGSDCSIDVDECQHYMGTDLACQNGARCINTPGSFYCLCSSGWFGARCTTSSAGCGNSADLCGNGVCLPTSTGFKCLCEQGWKTNETIKYCVIDVDECKESKPPCSVSPRVPCINTIGSFTCGACPIGYEGDGFYCEDIDECQTNNGGCSSNPRVQCANTLGSYYCGPCPPGYQGDGHKCTWRGSCSISNGGCHPAAKCTENTAIGPQYVMCTCPKGMVGDGFGETGCYIPSNITSALSCESNPCVHGYCHSKPEGYSCICHNGYKGFNCERQETCADSPCLNGGICKMDNSIRGYYCVCSASYTGDNCQLLVKACGANLKSLEGSLVYPSHENNSSKIYNHNTRCAWVIVTDLDKVLNVTFSDFNLEKSPDCTYDWLQIHDGRSAQHQMIGRYCGNKLPNGGNIISTHNTLYLWFRSDYTVAKQGFSLHWVSIKPVCGGEIQVESHGTIKSPGSPGNYPPNRDCYWHLTSTPTKVILLSFYLLEIEANKNCSYDFLEVFDGGSDSSPLLKRFCNTTVPPPLRSSGPELYLHFHSDSINSDHGFQIAYSLLPGINGCGGLFTIDEAEIMSPSTNGKYQHNLNCEYQISLAPGSKIKLTFLYFDLEDSVDCKDDSLTIYDGDSVNAKLISKLCGSTVPPTYISSGNKLLIIFRSDWAISSVGFRLTYKVVCHHVLTSINGVIATPGYSSFKSFKGECTYVIALNPGNVVKFSFTDFYLSSLMRSIYNHLGNETQTRNNVSNPCSNTFQYVEIHDGATAASPLVGSYCGNININKLPPIITSTHNYLYIFYNSKVALGGFGFEANYSSIDVGCGGIITENPGIIAYPTAPPYEPSMSCSWMLQAPVNYMIQLIWLSFDLEDSVDCKNDKLSLIELDPETGIEYNIGNYCGGKLPPATTSLDNKIIIKFQSDNAKEGTGFSLNYLFLDTTKSCGGNYRSMKGVLKSPRYPLDYPAQKDCIWTINIPSGQQILLNVTKFNLEDGGSYSKCNNDWLEIRNGGYERAPLIGKYCNSKIPNKIPSTGNQLYIHFHSDNSVSGNGFYIEWDGTATGCGGVLTSSTGSIISPNYPNPYGKNAECYWQITTSVGSFIQISFIELELEGQGTCLFDFLEIYEGIDMSGLKLGRYCNSNSPMHVNSHTNNIFLRFRSDISYEGKGFSLKYTTVCNNELHGYSGAIESLDFPNSYPNNLNCNWTIVAPRGNKINITFSHFALEGSFDFSQMAPSLQAMIRRIHNLSIESVLQNKIECIDDYLEIKDDSEKSLQPIKYCGDKVPQKYYSKSNHLEIIFHSDMALEYSGFRLEWVINGCGGIFRQATGFIESSHSLADCDWYIHTDAGTAIEINIRTQNMAADYLCKSNALIIFNGPDDTYPVLNKICKSSTTSYMFTSTSNYLLISQRSSSSLIASFTAHYRSILSKCGGKFRSLSGEITSPNYPNNYDSDLECIWSIEVPKHHLIKVEFLDFDIYYDNNCSDVVRIYDGLEPKRGINATKKFCGQSSKNEIFISNSNKIYIELKTDQERQAKGFKVKYSITCGLHIIADTDGMITNEDTYFMNTQNNSCSWTISTRNPNQRISITINIRYTSLQIDMCRTNNLKIYNGGSSEAPLLGTYCRKAPHTIVSQGSSLTITLESNEINAIKFYGHYSPITASCGGSIDSIEGLLASPMYPDNYPVNADCVWHAKTSPGNNLLLTFEMLDIEKSDYCNEDFLEIRENTIGGNILGIYCGNEIPTNITSGKNLYIIFHSNSQGTASGFLLNYERQYSSQIISDDENNGTGKIASPLYPNYYTGYFNEPYRWRISTKTGSIIKLSIKEILMDGASETDCYTVLEIYDGFDENAPLLMHLCGKTLPKPVKTTSNLVLIVFKGSENFDQDSIRPAKFLLEWQEIDTSKNRFGIESEEKSNCSPNSTLFVVRGGSIHINSPGYPKNYNDSMLCEWQFQSDSDSHLGIIFEDFDLEESDGCYMDSVNVYSKYDTSDQWISVTGDICYSNITENKSIETGNNMKLKFNTDPFITKKGFSASIFSTCGGHMTSPSGFIKPIYRKILNFKSLIDRCEWSVKVRGGRSIEVEFISMNITNENKESCDRYVMLRNGDSRDSPLLGEGKYCGIKLPDPKTLTTIGNYLFVSYVSNIAYDQVLGKNFNNSHEPPFIIKYSEKSAECGYRTIINDEANFTIISTPNYPNIPPPYSECVWVVQAPVGKRLRIDFIDRFDLTRTSLCTEESVEIRDGATENSDLIGRFCSQVPSTQKSTSNLLYIKFTTATSEPRNGFKSKISIDICGGTLRDFAGIFTSPGYPKPIALSEGVECEWFLIAPLGNVFWINVLDLDLPTARNSTDNSNTCISTLRIYDVIVETNTTISLHEPLCNKNTTIPLAIKSLSNQVKLSYQIAKPKNRLIEQSYKGFKVNFNITRFSCGGVLTSSTGFIQSLGYPLSTEQANCYWRIIVPSDRRVTLEIIDLDLDKSKSRLIIYGDYLLTYPIARLPDMIDNGKTIWESSSNIMRIYFYNTRKYFRKGFKAKYRSDNPALCTEAVSESNGSGVSPLTRYNDAYCCKWDIGTSKNNILNLLSYKAMLETISPIANKSLLIQFVNVTMSQQFFCEKVYIRLVSNMYDYFVYPKYEICTNTSSQIFRIPKDSIRIKACKNVNTSLSFQFSYKTQPCGGSVILSNVDTIIDLPQNHSGSLDCAWNILISSGRNVTIRGEGIFDHENCDTEYFSVSTVINKNILGQFCQTRPFTITSSIRHLFIEYHNDDYSNKTNAKLNLHLNTQICGGDFSGFPSMIRSPNYPNQYENNQECTWNIKANIGNRISLMFFDRFHIEETANCTKDFVEIFDYINGDFIPKYKLCGRTIPETIDSSENQLRITFRSDNSVNNIGFLARWKYICGGTFTATEHAQYLTSPSFMSGNPNCQYLIKAKDQYISLNFANFSLPDSRIYLGNDANERLRCRFGNLTIRSESDYTSVEHVYCGNEIPPSQKFRNSVILDFKANAFSSGFTFKYMIDSCNANITKPGIIKTPTSSDGDYLSHLTCRWNIFAPQDKIIILRFNYFAVEFTSQCSDDYVAIFDGMKTDIANRLALLCGSHKKISNIQSTRNEMVVKFVSDYGINQKGFEAEVIFMYNHASGCGGNVHIDNSTYTLRTSLIANSKNGQYKPFLDCHWFLRPPIGMELSVIFTKFHVAPCKNVNQTALSPHNCTCDYLEIIDGLSPMAYAIGRYCGHTLPMPITSSANGLQFRFVSDGEIESSGVEATISAVYTQCGKTEVLLTDKRQILEFPTDPFGNLQNGLNCRYKLINLNEENIHLKIGPFVLAPPSTIDNNCYKDRLDLLINTANHSLELGRDLILNKNFISDYEYYDRFPTQDYVLCGLSDSLDYYAVGSVTIKLLTATDDNIKKRLKIEYSLLNGCSRNYTNLQGRIMLKSLDNCTLIITAPENFTVNLYTFETIPNFYDDECNSYYNIYDGIAESAHKLTKNKICLDVNSYEGGFSSTGRHMTIKTHGTEYQEVVFDANYVTTDRGPGCGGWLQNYMGVVYSPSYPSPHRRQGKCEWRLETFPGTNLILQFKHFDLGSRQICQNNNLQLQDKDGNLIATYCSDDTPADYHSPNNYVKLIYHSDMNAGGSGWYVKFNSMIDDDPERVPIIEEQLSVL